MNHGLQSLCPLAFALACVATFAGAAPAKDVKARPLPYTGVNMASGCFGDIHPGTPLVYGKNFIYAPASDFDYFAAKGFNIVRLPFHWEVLQPKLNEPFDPIELERLQAFVQSARRRKLTVIIDPHNYARFNDKIVGTADVPSGAFADLWSRLSVSFGQDSHIWFGLMNEPHDMPTGQWLGAANAAIAAIRKTGAKNLILVPGNRWSGGQSWLDGDAEANGSVMLGVKDPMNHYLFEAHQYLDADTSGTHETVVSQTIGVERLVKFTEWCRRNHQKALLGEFAAGDTPDGKIAIEQMLDYLEKNRDVWVGYAWWCAGPWLSDYMYTLEPKDGAERPQMAWLTPHVQRVKTPRMQPVKMEK